MPRVERLLEHLDARSPSSSASAAKPMISTSSPVLTCPRSIRPVTTVPRPLIPNTSSIGIRNGRSIGRSGVGMYSSTASISSRIEAYSGALGVGAGGLERLHRRAPDDRDVVAGEVVLREQLAQLHLDQLEQLLVLHQVDLVQVDHHGRHFDLAGQQDVLAGLGHRAVGRRDHQDRAVHLGRPGDHVLDVVGVPRAVHVGVVPRLGLVLDVRDGDRDAARALLGRVVDLVERRDTSPCPSSPAPW